MTDTSHAANAQGPDTSPATFITMLHHNLALFTDSVAHFLPRLEAIATNPMLDDGVEAFLAAFAGPMAAEVFAAVIAFLKADPADHMDAAIALLTVVAHKPAASSGQAFADGAANMHTAVVAAVHQAQQPAAATGPQQTMQPRVIV